MTAEPVSKFGHTDPTAHAARYFQRVRQTLEAMDVEAVGKVITVLAETRAARRTIFLAGNGGSASTASHMASDLSKTILGMPVDRNKQGFRAIALTDNLPLLTAWANDEGYDQIFSGQLRSLANKGDLLIVISGSGNSENLVRGVAEARAQGLMVIGFLGRGGGKLASMVDLSVVVPCDEYGPIEDVHFMLNHLITAFFLADTNATAAHQ